MNQIFAIIIQSWNDNQQVIAWASKDIRPTFGSLRMAYAAPETVIVSKDQTLIWNF